MNSFVQSKTEVFEKIEESLRPPCMVENLNDDEIMELCICSGFDNCKSQWNNVGPLDRAEYRRVQNREQPELLVGSPSSLLNTCVESQEISKLKTERIEPQIRNCVQAYKLQMAMQKHFVHEHPKDSASWDMLEVQSPVSDPRMHIIGGPMCRWILKARGSNERSS